MAAANPTVENDFPVLGPLVDDDGVTFRFCDVDGTAASVRLSQGIGLPSDAVEFVRAEEGVDGETPVWTLRLRATGADRIEYAGVRGSRCQARQGGKPEHSGKAERPTNGQWHCISPAASSDAESHASAGRQRLARCPRNQPTCSRDGDRFGHCHGEGQVLTLARRWASRRCNVRSDAGRATSGVGCDHWCAPVLS